MIFKSALAVITIILLATFVDLLGDEKTDTDAANIPSIKALDLDTCQSWAGDALQARNSEAWCHKLKGWDTSLAEP